MAHANLPSNSRRRILPEVPDEKLDETITALRELGGVLRGIYDRLKAEGALEQVRWLIYEERRLEIRDLLLRLVRALRRRAFDLAQSDHAGDDAGLPG